MTRGRGSLSGLVLAVGLLTPADGESVAELLAAHRDGGASQRSAARRALTDLGPACIPEILAIRSGLVRGSEPVILDEEAKGLLEDVLGSWPPGEVVQATRLGLTSDVPAQMRLHGADLIGAVGDANAVKPLLETLSGIDLKTLAHPRITGRVESSLASLLERDRGSYQILAEQLSDVDPTLLPVLARSLGSVGRDEACTLLERLLGRSRELDVVVLEVLGRWPVWSYARREGKVAALITPFLDSPEVELRRMAAVSLGRLREIDNLDILMTMFADDDPRPARGALWAAREITGLGWSAEDESWSSLRGREDEWLRSRGEALETLVEGDDAARAAAAIREISAHPLGRHTLRGVLEHAVDHPSESVAAAACRVLGQMGNASSVPVLVEALHDHRDGVSVAAERALARMAGMEITANDWRDLQSR